MGGVTGTPHHPRRGRSQGTGEGQHLHAGIVAEGRVGDDAILDRVGGPGPHRDGPEKFEDRPEDHGLSVRDGARRHTGSPGVGHIVWTQSARPPAGPPHSILTGTVIIRIQHGEQRPDDEDVRVVREHHLGCILTRLLAVELWVGREATGSLEADAKSNIPPSSSCLR